MVKYPDDWKVVSYGDVFIHHSAKEHQVSASAYATSGDYPVIDQGQMPVVGYTNDASCVMRCPRGGMIVFGDHTRIIKFVDFDFVVGADGTQLLSCKEGCDARYVYYYMQSMHIPNLGYSRHFKYVKEGVYVLPPLPEQKRIAAVLGKVDKLIDNLSRQIEKKRLVKQGVMQDLLTGKKRLPGFTGEWAIGKVGPNYFLKGRIGWQGLKASEFIAEGPHLITGTDFRNGCVDWSVSYHIPRSRYLQDVDLQVVEDDLLVTKDGTIGKLAYIDYVPGECSLNSHLLLMRPTNPNYVNKYLFYVMSSQYFTDYISSTHSGTTMASLSQAQISRFTYPLPPPAEQKAIAKVLSDMDAEIAKLEAKREKYRQLKQGLMNDLLTGKVRIK